MSDVVSGAASNGASDSGVLFTLAFGDVSKSGFDVESVPSAGIDSGAGAGPVSYTHLRAHETGA